MHFEVKLGDNQYMVIGCRDGYMTEDEDESQSYQSKRVDTYEIFPITGDFHGLVYEYYREHPDPNVLCVAPSGAIDDNGVWIGWEPEEPAKKKPRKARRKVA